MSTAKREVSRTNDKALKEVQRLFEDLRQAINGLEKMVMGQRRINGRLYKANEETLNLVVKLATGHGKVKPEPAFLAAKKEVEEYLDGVGGDEPPGCELPRGN